MKNPAFIAALTSVQLFLAATMPAVGAISQAARYAPLTNTVVAYKIAHDMFQPIASVDPAKLQIHVFVSSTDKAVHPADIRFAIHSAIRGWIPISMNTNGRVLAFPMDKELRRENPPIVANQPGGTLRVGISVQIPPTDDLTFRYGRLADGVAEINKAIRMQAGFVLSLFVPKVHSVIFLFPRADAGKATVEIASISGIRKYTANRNGVVKLKLEKALVAENPEVILSEKPNHIVPDMSVL
jgi:hypothetical protein